MNLGTGIRSRLRETLDARTEPEGIHTIADLFWHLLLAVLFCAFVVIFLWGTLDLVGILNMLSETPKKNVVTKSALDRNTLDTFLQMYHDRTTQFKVLESNPPPPVPDPSR
jgi:hypothetical protein